MSKITSRVDNPHRHEIILTTLLTHNKWPPYTLLYASQTACFTSAAALSELDLGERVGGGEGGGRSG